MIESKLAQIYEQFQQAEGISTDTRKITQNSMFVALKGPSFDANKFAVEALSKGAKFAVVDDPHIELAPGIILVNDCLQFLQDLARYHRKKLQCPVIGITGSNGKTTTKELLFAVLKNKFETYSTQGNLNNHIGVPLTILAIPLTAEMAIVEMGANHIGEIADLCTIAQPTHGIITNIGHAHIEGFGSFEGVLRAKSELYHYLIEHQGIAFVNSSDEVLKNMSKRFGKPVFYPSVGDFFEATFIEANPFVKFSDSDGKLHETNLLGKYNFINIAAALCIGTYFGVDSSEAYRTAENYIPDNNRSQIIQHGSNTIILDAYNANPSSMDVAIDSFDEINNVNKVVILGDMFELGNISELEHQKIGEKLSNSSISHVLLVGDQMRFAQKACAGSKHFTTKMDLVEYLKKEKFDHAHILIKASRGIGLETIVDYL